MFEEFYKSELARRLLLQRYSSIDLEKAAIARLKTVLQFGRVPYSTLRNSACRSAGRRLRQSLRRCFKIAT
jgi:hypothetical protein